MIRDFCQIANATLAKEIDALREPLDNHTAPRGVTHESVDAIDAVPKVGNIGAHMEGDISLVVGVEPGEAQMLIGLVEMLCEEWHVEQYARTKRLAQITSSAPTTRNSARIASWFVVML